MNRTIPKLAPLHVILGLCLCAAVAQSASGPKELTHAAQLVFRGTIQKVEASNLEIVQADSGVAVVRVDEVLKTAPSLGDLTGREITVKLAQPGDATPGEQAVFFTNGWLYGKTLAVVEVGRLHGDAALLRGQVAGAASQAADGELQGRLAGAEVVVAGRVVETHPAAVVVEVGEGSEHDPQWWEAVVQVDAVFLGKAAGQRVTFFYPTSQDVVWFEAPKPAVGADGIWLLYRDQLPELGLPGYTALKPWNVLPRGQANRVRRLLLGQ
ncbi:MAG TPA: hypothetical protein VLX28_23400 [Thermoanaerobaculia bacterium]|nr:hypothetical protein [Thermoanaerobaculia bacterium]